jgi:protease II
MKQYSPQDNICLNSKYPNIFIYSNLHDTNVSFDEAYKYYNTIKNARVFLNKERDIHMMINMKYGHSQSSKRYEKNKEIAQIYDIIIKYIK